MIPTGNRHATLEPTVLAALANSEAAEVIVVVNGSTDGSLDLLEALACDHPRLRPHQLEVRGESAARQRGAELASGEVVLFLDDDVIATPQLAAGHARHHRDNPSLVVVGYMPVGPEQLRAQAEARLYGADYERACSKFEQDPREVLVQLWGGNVSLRRADCLAVGFTTTFASPQRTDTDFGIRCYRYGLVGIFDRNLRAEHRYVRSRSGFLERARDQTRAAVLIQEHNADLLTAADADSPTDGLPSRWRWVMDAGTNNRLGRCELLVLHGLQRVAHRQGRRRLEDHALVLARIRVQLDEARRLRP